MSDRLDFTGPFLKIERARHHIGELDAIFREHISALKKASIPSKNINNRKHSVGRALPRYTPTILGDAIHNMRVSLDHAYCILVEANGGNVTSKVKFPFTEKGTRQDLEGSIKGHAKAGCGPSATVIAHIFDVIQPYPEGAGADLLAIHMLDIADKHMILLPMEQITRAQDVTFENDRGVPIVSFKDVVFKVPGGASGAEIVGPLSPRKGNNISAEINFGKGQPLEAMLVISTLNKLIDRVSETVKSLEPFI